MDLKDVSLSDREKCAEVIGLDFANEFNDDQLPALLHAIKEDPEGVRKIAKQANRKSVDKPAALLIWMIREGKHTRLASPRAMTIADRSMALYAAKYEDIKMHVGDTWPERRIQEFAIDYALDQSQARGVESVAIEKHLRENLAIARHPNPYPGGGPEDKRISEW